MERPRSQHPPAHPFEILVKTFGEFAVVVDSVGTVVLASCPTRKSSQTFASLRAAKLRDLLGGSYSVFKCLFNLAIEKGRLDDWQVEIGGGRPQRFSVGMLSLSQASERAKAVAVIARDVTMPGSPDERSRKSKGLFAEVERIAHLGSWELDVATRQIIWSEGMYRLLGLNSAQEQLTPELFFELVHPDDRVRATDLAFYTHGALDEAELRFLLPSGARIVRVLVFPIAHGEENSPHIMGIVQDLTDSKQAQAQLQNSDALLAKAEEMANLGSWEYNTFTGQATISHHCKRMFGFGPDEAFDPDRYLSGFSPQDQQRIREIASEAQSQHKPYGFTAVFHRHDGVVRCFQISAAPVQRGDLHDESYRGTVKDVTEQLRAEQDLRHLSSELIRARDNERRQVARELHETAGQSLAALKMTLGRLRETLPEDDEEARGLLQASLDLAEDAVREVRVISYLMHPPMLDEGGLEPALRWFAKGFSGRSGIAVRVEIPEYFGRYSQEIETTVFHIVQEALTNVHRYSGSRSATIFLSMEDPWLRLEVRDQGCGLPVPEIAGVRRGVSGVGIAGMRERVKQLHGEFEVESVPGHGTTVRALLLADARISSRSTDSAPIEHSTARKEAYGQG